MPFSRNILFTILLVGFIFGVLLFNAISDIILVSIIILFILIVGCCICYVYRRIFIGLCFLFIGSCLGIVFASYDMSIKTAHIDTVVRYEGLYNTYEGVVKKLHKRSDYYDEYIVMLDKIGDTIFSNDIRHILRIPKNFILHPGQKIGYNGVMYLIEDFDGFAYKKYMLSKNIYFSSSTNSIDKISDNATGFNYSMYDFRENLLSRIESIFPQREAIFLGGILFGARENIPQELKEDFNNSGLTHFIAVSGFNITLCIIFMTYLVGFLPVYIRTIFVIVSIVLFSLFVGLGAPVVRAAIMGILGYIFLQSGNRSQNITLLAFTAVAMALFSPLSLSYDVSMHLSFLAVIGIMYTQDIFAKLFIWVPSTFAIREALVLTFSALSFALPIMIFQFGQVSLLAPFANIAVTWTIPLAMLGGTLTLIVDFISPVLGSGIGFITWILLRFDMLMVELFGNIDWALLRVDFGLYGSYLQILYFIILTYILFLYHSYKKRQS